MTNKSMLDRVLMAYRPLYLHGLMLDGQYRLPATAKRVSATRQRRMLLVALAGLRHIILPTRNQP
jgi:hypothetical protein